MKKSRRGKLPRVSSPEGIKARQDLRVKGYEAVPQEMRTGYTRPGSSNPRKAGR